MRSESGRSSATFLDTQILVWLAITPERLTASARHHLETVHDDLVVSAVNPFEATDLNRRSRFGRDLPLAPILTRLDTALLPFPVEALKVAGSLPDIHRDPVDLMLVAHAILMGATIVTADAAIHRYPVATVW